MGTPAVDLSQLAMVSFQGFEKPFPVFLSAAVSCPVVSLGYFSGLLSPGATLLSPWSPAVPSLPGVLGVGEVVDFSFSLRHFLPLAPAKCSPNLTF